MTFEQTFTDPQDLLDSVVRLTDRALTDSQSLSDVCLPTLGSIQLGHNLGLSDALTLNLESTIIPESSTNRLFSFLSNDEDFSSVTLATGVSATWSSTVGNPAGSLQTRVSGKNRALDLSYREWIGTWENLGIIPGAVISSVQLTSGWSRCSEFNTALSSTHGPYEIWNSAGTVLIATLWPGRSITATDAGVSIGAQSSTLVPSLYKSTDTVIRIRLNYTMGTGSSNQAAVALHDDELQLTVVHTVPPINRNDTLGLTDATALSVSKLFSDSTGQSDALAIAIGKGLVDDTVALTDSRAHVAAYQRVVFESVHLSETIQSVGGQASGFWTWTYLKRIGT